MRMVDIIGKKRHGLSLTVKEIQFFVEEYTAGRIPDYQASALLMAVCFAGMNDEEIAALTLAMANSGEMVDLSMIPGVKVDKHSTGGVGDKTTLIVGPIVASCGAPVAKMSGRGLGHTGGTIDKMESIPGMRTALSREEFLDTVKKIGISVAGQSGNLAPADKKLYALRDVTSTVDSIPLIAASVMSKKIAAGADAIVLDVKCGSGAFCKTTEDAVLLARQMVRIGQLAKRDTLALVTNMDIPLGHAIGNSLEIAEVVEVLRGVGPKDLAEISIELAAAMLALAGKGELARCRELASDALRSGRALEKLRQMVEAQGGDPRCIDDPSRLPQPTASRELLADRDGVITAMDCEGIGRASMLLGAGRADKDAAIDYAAGILLRKKTGDRVFAGEPIAELLTTNPATLVPGEEALRAAITVGDGEIPEQALILARIGGNHETEETTC